MDRILEFTSNHTLLVAGLLISFFVVVFSELRRKAGGVANVDATDAVKLINNDAVVVDLRSAESFGGGHIVNARNIPFDELQARMSSLDKFKSKPVVTVCDAGNSSLRVVHTLRQAGFESVYSLKGGMTGWSQAGFPVVTGKKTKSKSEKGKKRG